MSTVYKSKNSHNFDLTIIIITLLAFFILFTCNRCTPEKRKEFFGKEKVSNNPADTSKTIIGVTFKGNNLWILYYDSTLKQYELKEDNKYINNVIIIKNQ